MRAIILGLLFSVVALMSTSTNLIAQKAIKKITSKKNAITLLLPDYNFMDGSPKVFLFSNIGFSSFGLEYNRISPKNNWIVNISGSYYEMWYYGLDDYFINVVPGDLFSRFNSYYSANCFRSLFSNRLTALYAGLGVNYRRGLETIHVGYYGLEEIVGYKRLRDMGFRAALMEKIDLPFNFMLTGQVSYTRYVYRYYKGIGFPAFDGGSTKNLITYQIGIGYRF